jgi:hypothetical protein
MSLVNIINQEKTKQIVMKTTLSISFFCLIINMLNPADFFVYISQSFIIFYCILAMMNTVSMNTVSNENNLKQPHFKKILSVQFFTGIFSGIYMHFTSRFSNWLNAVGTKKPRQFEVLMSLIRIGSIIQLILVYQTINQFSENYFYFSIFVFIINCSSMAFLWVLLEHQSLSIYNPEQ